MDKKKNAQRRNFNKRCLTCAIHGLKNMIDTRKDQLTFNEKVKIHEMINIGTELLKNWPAKLDDK